MINFPSELILGWILGLVSSLLTGVVLFWLEGKREARRIKMQQNLEDIRNALNWAYEGKKRSLRGFNLAGANLSGKDLAGADLENANLENAALWQTNFAEANLRRTNFKNAKLVNVNFQKANLLLSDFTNAILRDCIFTEVDLHHTNLSKVKTIENCIWKSAKVTDGTQLSSQLKREIERQSVVD